MRLLLLVTGALVISCLVLGLVVFTVWARYDRSTVGKVDFHRPLAIPPLAESHVDAAGRRVFDLRLQPGETDFGRGRPTRTWGVNGSYLGPTLRAARGEKVLVNVTNGIGEPTTLHWHGMELPARMDGGPHQTIQPDTTWSPTWTIDQPAASLWYHPHLHGATQKHVYRGLAGMFLVDDAASARLALPNRYGVDDLPLIVQDKRFTGGGQLSQGSSTFSPTGFLGDTIVVNGTVSPYREVRTERVRLRLLNASNARVYGFGFADGREFAVVGTDGGLLPAPRAARRVQVSPGDRVEIVVTMRPGETVVLRSERPNLGADFLNDRLAGGDDRFDVLELRAAARLTPSPPLPDRLAEVPPASADEAVRTRAFNLAGNAINGAKMDPDRIDQVVTAGSTEIWAVTNRDGAPHNFHVHGVQFRVLGDDLPPELSGWQDTVFLNQGRTRRLLIRFTAPPDPETPFMYHCHLLRHEDQGMMGQYTLTPPDR